MERSVYLMVLISPHVTLSSRDLCIITRPSTRPRLRSDNRSIPQSIYSMLHLGKDCIKYARRALRFRWTHATALTGVKPSALLNHRPASVLIRNREITQQPNNSTWNSPSTTDQLVMYLRDRNSEIVKAWKREFKNEKCDRYQSEWYILPSLLVRVCLI